MTKNNVTFDDKANIEVPQRDLMCIEKRDWKRIKRTVSSMKTTQNVWQSSAAWTVLGLLFGCIIAAIQDPQRRKVYLFIASASLIIAVVLFIGARDRSKISAQNATDLMTELEEIEESSFSGNNGTTG
jgi:hypothetical protein